jgi:SAM-dependent methyltransferase
MTATASATPDKTAADKVQEEVSDLYESFPYPGHGIISSVLPRLAHRVVGEVQSRVDRPRYLDAGCGTGEQTLGMKRAYPSLDVTGVDYSKASLAFARDLSAKSSLSARFEWCDLMKPLSVGPFDLITSVGVLMTLPDPAAGFRTLRGAAAKGAMFVGMVYGTYGKWDLFRMRDALEAIAGPNASREERLGLLSDIHSKANTGVLHYLSTLKTRRAFGPSIAPTEAIKRVLKGRSPAYQADAFTCPQEITYTWKELAELLASTGWEWQGWPEHSGMPDHASQVLSGEALARVERMPKIEQAAIFERLVCPGNLFFIARAV